jgi:hypothetical protein
MRFVNPKIHIPGLISKQKGNNKKSSKANEPGT